VFGKQETASHQINYRRMDGELLLISAYAALVAPFAEA
jgi:hypothetical protein